MWKQLGHITYQIQKQFGNYGWGLYNVEEDTFNYNKHRNKEIVTFISEICMLPYLEEVFRKNENGCLFPLKKKKKWRAIMVKETGITVGKKTEHEFPIKYIRKAKLTVIFYFTQIQFILILFSKNRDLHGIYTKSEI